MKVKIKKSQNPTVFKMDVSHSLIERFNSAFDEVGDVLVNRTEEIEAVKLCLLTKSHLMLEGKHGIAKSQLADEVFSRIVGAKVFKKQFMKGTQTDEVVGPMNAKRYREEAVWEHNITGMLPDCHFFYGDEIYRASDQCLPVMMGMLNEREFINGGKVLKCPLMTAIGTTNFTTDSEELEAFHDRWHVRVNCQPLTSNSDVRTMLQRVLNPEKGEKSTILLEELIDLQDAVKDVTFSDEVIQLLPDIFGKFSNVLQKIYISDRRKVQCLSFMKAQALLRGETEVGVEDMEGARYIITNLRDKMHSQAWANIVTTIVQEAAQLRSETKDLRKLERRAEVLEGRFDPNMPEREMKALWDETKNMLSAINNAPPEERPKSTAGVERTDAVKRKLEELCQSITQKNVF